ncbi:MAG TPA: hypothetical protein VH062_23965 [Polyangiaceae bacterium]|nr:hypothetical protein [Polyangiaceae bacterium]
MLETPLEVKRALVYVLQNHRHHAAGVGQPTPAAWLDPVSTAPYFDGFTVRTRRARRDEAGRAPSPALRVWSKTHRPIAPDDAPV